jgi:hypothetical protein
LLHDEAASATDIASARHEAISHAAFRVLTERYADSVHAGATRIALTTQMLELGYDPFDTSTEGATPSALGSRIAESVLNFTASDRWDDHAGFFGGDYTARNEPLPVVGSGTSMSHPNHWQPLLFEEAFTQNQQTTDLVQSFLGAHWGGVRPVRPGVLP